LWLCVADSEADGFVLGTIDGYLLGIELGSISEADGFVLDTAARNLLGIELVSIVGLKVGAGDGDIEKL